MQTNTFPFLMVSLLLVTFLPLFTLGLFGFTLRAHGSTAKLGGDGMGDFQP